MIQVDKLFHHYVGTKVLCGPSLALKSGEIVVVMGPNGMGKSTMLACIGGALVPVDGTVEINNRRRYQNETDELAIRQETMYLPDAPWMPQDRTCRQWAYAVASLWRDDHEWIIEHIDSLIKLFDMEKVADSPIRSYSAGQKKKAQLIMALAPNTPVLVFDEPFSGGLDPTGLYAIKEILRRRAHTMNHTVLIATPTPELVEEVADRVAILRDGTIIAQGTINELREQSGSEGNLISIYEHISSSGIQDRLQQYEKQFLSR